MSHATSMSELPDRILRSDHPSEASASTSSSTLLPDLHLLCIKEEAAQAFKIAISEHFPALHQYSKIQIHECSLKYLDRDLQFSAVVSPANCYARLDGAFDDALAKAFGPAGDYDWITRKAQDVLYQKWRGYAPPGTCTVVPLDHDAPGDGAEKNPWKTCYLLLCPTMRIPWEVKWDREVVYECIWSLLCAVDEHNRNVRNRTDGHRAEIRSILMTPLATGCGNISNKRWAEQAVIAVKHWIEAVEEPQVWSRMRWNDVFERHGELTDTWEGDVD